MNTHVESEHFSDGRLLAMKAMNQKVIIHEVIEPLEGGAPKHVGLLASGISSDKFEVTLVYPQDKQAPFFFSLPGYVKHERVPMGHDICFCEDLKSFYSLFWFFRKTKPDIVHAHSSKAGFLARCAARLAGVKRVLYTAHGFSFIRQDIGKWKRLFFLLLEKFCGFLTDGVVAVSQSEANEASKIISKSKIFVNPNGISLDQRPKDHAVYDVARYRPSLSDGTKDQKPETSRQRKILVGASGRITPAKDPELFFEMAQEMHRQKPNIEFIWIGGYENENEIRNWKLEIEESKIPVTGWLHPSEAMRKMQELDVFVMTSQWEGLPFVLLEAMGLGKPAVVLNRAGLGNIVRHGQTGLVAENKQEMVECIERLADDPDACLKMGQAAREAVKSQYSCEAMVHRLEDYYLLK